MEDALSRYEGFEKSFPDIQPIADSLYKQGLPYQEALRRGYLAVHPEATSEEAQRIAAENINIQGRFSTRASFSPKIGNFKKGRELTQGEKFIAKSKGLSEEAYGKLMDTHDSWLRSNGFYHESLNKPLSEEL